MRGDERDDIWGEDIWMNEMTSGEMTSGGFTADRVVPAAFRIVPVGRFAPYTSITVTGEFPLKLTSTCKLLAMLYTGLGNIKALMLSITGILRPQYMLKRFAATEPECCRH